MTVDRGAALAQDGIADGASRVALERALRLIGDAGLLARACVHNVRLQVGADEFYGRDDWIAFETRRFAEWGALEPVEWAALSMPWGRELTVVAAAWSLGSAPGSPQAGVLGIAHAGRLAYEWQCAATTSLPFVARPRSPAPIGVSADFGVVRAAPGQQWPAADAAALIAPRGIADTPLVRWWHRRWNVRDRAATLAGFTSGATLQSPELAGAERAADAAPAHAAGLLARYDEPAMFVERLATSADGALAVLQWRLVGRSAADAAGAQPRSALHGLSFFRLTGGLVRAEFHCFDPPGPTAARVAGSASYARGR